MDDSGQTIEACFSNARDFLRAAIRVLNDERLPNIAFHLALLALEEVGKAVLVGTRGIARTVDNETGFIDSRLDDHVFKLFWALWTPSFARGNISREEFENLRGLARGMHDERLAALYVAPDRQEGAAAIGSVSEDRARLIIELAEARLGMETSRDWQSLDLGAGSILRWFLDATGTPEKRDLIFGQKSFDKLAELGQVREWMTWLKEQFDQAESEARNYMQREVVHATTDPAERGEDRWKVAVRLYSTAQSIRNSAIGSWNGRPTWIRLSTVQNDKQAIEVEFTLGTVVGREQLALAGFSAARLFLVAMNIGSTGFWWWSRPDHAGRYYQRLTDLDAPSGMKLDVNTYSGPKIEWSREALKEPQLTRIGICFGMAGRLDRPVYGAIIDSYFAALALVAKSDLSLDFAPQASERFALCLFEAMRHFGDWDGTNENLETAIAKGFPPMQEETRQHLIALLRQLRRQPLDPAGLTLERAAILKHLCDVYLIQRFEQMAQGVASTSPAEPSQPSP
ncbi:MULTISPECIES: AbiV family abortive infection protein [unclassified Bradyrhizobium]|uniref:AbiV family abortive infection protein n=1 Tax=unclassified Bradyrhizobium TaxID=2631580 RepID=UPI002916534F|nr:MULTISPECIES: AbiV family abortive infection protein [unclassified Bradyrhizobium]